MKAQIPFSPLNSFIHLFVPIPPSLLPTSLCPEPPYIIVMSAWRRSNRFALDQHQLQILQPVAEKTKTATHAWVLKRRWKDKSQQKFILSKKIKHIKKTKLFKQDKTKKHGIAGIPPQHSHHFGLLVQYPSVLLRSLPVVAPWPELACSHQWFHGWLQLFLDYSHVIFGAKGKTRLTRLWICELSWKARGLVLMERGWTHRHAECTRALHPGRHQIRTQILCFIIFPTGYLSFRRGGYTISGCHVQKKREKKNGRKTFLHSDCGFRELLNGLCVLTRRWLHFRQLLWILFGEKKLWRDHF